MPSFHRQSVIPCSARELFDWHASPGAFTRLGPPWQSLEIRDQQGSIYDGDILEFAIKDAPIPVIWRALHEDTIEGEQFCDVQQRGPFGSWRHVHRFIPQDDHTCVLDDSIEYTLPLHAISGWADGLLVRGQLERMFDFRHERTVQDITRHQTFHDKPRQTIAITGASGLVGSALTDFLTTGGHTVRHVVRSPPKADHEIYWSPSKNEIDAQGFEGVDVVIHLAGAGIAAKRWDDDYKRTLLDSRVQGTALLARTLASMKTPPHTLISASAVGYYGSERGDEILNEQSASGTGFLAGVCRQWEEAAQPAIDAGIRVVYPRFGLILSGQGGLLDKMSTPFKLGTGGKLGNGRHYMSWVAIDDVLGALNFLMFTPEITGPVNVTAADPVTNAAFTKVLGRVLSRPTIMTVPRFALKAALGTEMAEETTLASQRAVPERLMESGFEFFYPDLEQTLRHLLGK